MASFQLAGDGTIFGSLGRNILRGPDQHNFDMPSSSAPNSQSRSGSSPLGGFQRLNHPNFANPASDVSSPSTFGKISAMSVNPRIMQYGLKLEF